VRRQRNDRCAAQAEHDERDGCHCARAGAPGRWCPRRGLLLRFVHRDSLKPVDGC
jgi:hypothetical protein